MSLSSSSRGKICVSTRAGGRHPKLRRWSRANPRRRTKEPAEALAHADKADPHAVLLLARVHAPPARQVPYGVLRGKVAEREEGPLQGRERGSRQVVRLVFSNVGAAVERRHRRVEGTRRESGVVPSRDPCVRSSS